MTGRLVHALAGCESASATWTTPLSLRVVMARPAALEYLQHRQVFGQHLGDKHFEAGRPCNPDQVIDQMCRDAQSLMRIVDRKRYLGAAGRRDDIPCAAHDHLLPAFGEHRDQRHVVGEVDIEEELDLALAEAALWRKEPSVQCLAAEPADSSEHFGAVAGLQRPDLQRCSVAQVFGDGVRGGVHDGRLLSVAILGRYLGGYGLSMTARTWTSLPAN